MGRQRVRIPHRRNRARGRHSVSRASLLGEPRAAAAVGARADSHPPRGARRMTEFDEPRAMLRRLATRLGIVDSYVDQTGGHVRHTSDHTRERLLAAMGYDASTEESARAAL